MPIAHHVSCRPANSDNLHPSVPVQIQCNQVLDRDFPRLNQRPLPLTQLGNGRKRRERAGSRGESCHCRTPLPHRLQAVKHGGARSSFDLEGVAPVLGWPGSSLMSRRRRSERSCRSSCVGCSGAARSCRARKTAGGTLVDELSALALIRFRAHCDDWVRGVMQSRPGSGLTTRPAIVGVQLESTGCWPPRSLG